MKKKCLMMCMAFIAMMACMPVFGQDDGSDLVPTAKYGFTDEDGHLVIGIQFDDVNWFSEGLASVGVSDGESLKYGFIDTKGNMVIPLQFDDARSFFEGLAAVMDGNDKWGFVDKKGKMVVAQQYDEVGDFSDGIASVYVGDYWDGKWGCIDHTGKMLIEPLYDDALVFKDGKVASNSIDGNSVLVNIKGKQIVESESGIEGFQFEDGFGCASVDDKYGFLDENGWILEPQFDQATLLHGMGIAIQEESWGILNSKGKWIIEMNDKEGYFAGDEEGAFIMKYDGKFIVIDDKGLKELPFEDLGEFSENLAAVKIGGKWGYVDNMGKKVIKPQFEAADDFSEGLAAVQVNGKWGYIDTDGRMVIQPKFDEAGQFYGGNARVMIGDYSHNESGLIDKTGKFIK